MKFNEMMKIGDIADVHSGFAFKSKDLSDDNSGIRVIKIGNLNGSEVDYSNTQFFPKKLITKKIEKFALEDRDILIAMTGQGSVGRVSQLRKKKKDDYLLLNQRVGKFIVDSEKGDRDFLFFVLSSKRYQDILFAAGSGSGQPNLSPSIIKNIQIPKLDIDIQRKIGQFLSLLNDKIENNNKINNNLHELSDNLYNEWFVKFNFPNFDSKLKNSELGMIPEKWNVGYFDDGILTKIIKSGVQNYEGFKKYIATADVTNTDIINYTLVDYDNKPSRANMTPISSSVWFAKMENSIKNILVDDYMDDILNDYIFSTGFMGIECYKSSVNYIWSIINNSKFIDIKNSLSTGTLMAGISNTTIVNFKYIIPDDETLIQYNLKLREINKKIYNNKKQNETLSQLRDTLLPKLMNGEIDLDNIEI